MTLYFNSLELLQYSMTKTRLEDIDFLLTPEAQQGSIKDKIDCT